MTDIEIPYPKDRNLTYRLFEMLPGFLSWMLILMPALLALFNPLWSAYFIVAYVLIWFIKAMAMAIRAMQGYRRMGQARSINWHKYLYDLEQPEAAIEKLSKETDKLSQIHGENLKRYLESGQTIIKPKHLVQMVIVAVYNESREIVEPTIEAVKNAKYPHKLQTMLVIAYEARGGEQVEAMVRGLIKDHGDAFLHAEAVKHPPDIPGEVIGKGGNVTYAGRKILKWVKDNQIEAERVIVTTLDADNRPDKNYFESLSYSYLVANRRTRKSFQPVPMYTNNIWDAPAPMRVIAVGNSFWQIIQSTRLHMLRNFSSHAQPLQALIDTDFWSVRTIVEDGHQFWRTYFRYDGDHEVLPIYVPIYQDAVLAEGYGRTFKMQFIQLRRWAWGASDIAYVITRGYFSQNKVSRFDLLAKASRLVEGHVSWASASVLLMFSAWVPLFVSPEAQDSVVAHQLPIFASRVQMFAMLGIFFALYFNLKILPPKPERYKRRHHVFMVLQWVLLPVVSIIYGGGSALYSQTRLFFGKYLGKFDVTEKAVKSERSRETRGWRRFFKFR